MLLDLDWRHTGYLAAALREAGIQTLLVSTGWPDRIGLGGYCRQVRSPQYTSAFEQMKRVSPRTPFAQAFVRGARQLMGGLSHRES